MRSSTKLLRACALAGTAVVLVQQVLAELPLRPRQETGLVVLVLALLLVALTLRFIFPAALARLLGYKDLLVPLGLLVFAEGVLGWLLFVPAVATMLSHAWPVKFAGLGLSLSAAFVITIFLNVAYASWTTTLILNLIRRGQGDLVEGLVGLRLWFWRVLGLESVGWTVLFAGVAAAVLLAPDAMPVAIFIIGVGSVLWNLATAALLVVALDRGLRFWPAFRRGVRVSWRAKRRWWKPVLIQMILLGWVTYLSVSYSETHGSGHVTQHTSTNWSVNGFWTGGYENECRWYGKLLETLNAPKLAAVATALGLIFGVLAIAVKLRIAEDEHRDWLAQAGPNWCPACRMEGIPDPGNPTRWYCPECRRELQEEKEKNETV